MEEGRDNIPSATENMEGSANDMIASTSEQNMEGSANYMIASTSEQNMEGSGSDTIASTSMTSSASSAGGTMSVVKVINTSTTGASANTTGSPQAIRITKAGGEPVTARRVETKQEKANRIVAEAIVRAKARGEKNLPRVLNQDELPAGHMSATHRPRVGRPVASALGRPAKSAGGGEKKAKAKSTGGAGGGTGTPGTASKSKAKLNTITLVGAKKQKRTGSDHSDGEQSPTSPSTLEEDLATRMEEDCINSSESTSEQKMDLGSGSDLERCSNCKAIFSLFKVRISSLVDAKKLFPHLSGASNFLCMDCVKMVKSKTKLDGFNKKRTWAGSGSSSVDSTPPPSKRDKTNVTVGGGVPALPPAPTSTQNTEGPVRYVVVIPKMILSVAPSKQNEDSVNVTKPCKLNLNSVTAVGPSASMLNMAGSVKKPPTQNMGASVEAASTSKPDVERTVSAPLTLNDSPQYNDMPMPCTSEQGAEGSCSKTVQRCSLCKKEIIKLSKGYKRIRISVMVDLKTAQMLLPHLSPEEFVCHPCLRWVNSKTKPLHKGGGKRTWIGFSEQNMEEDCPVGGGGVPALPPAPTSTQITEGPEHYVVIPKTVLSVAPSEQNKDSVNVTKPCKPNMNGVTAVGPSASMLNMAGSVFTSDGPSPAPKNDMPPASEQSSEGSASSKRCSHCSKELTKSSKGFQRIRISKLSTSDAPPAANKTRSRKSIMIDNLRRGRYYRAVKSMVAVPTARRALITVCQQIINKERIKLARDKEGPFRKQPTRENLSLFSWKETNAWVEEKAPLTMECLRSMFPQANKMAGQKVVPSATRRRNPLRTEEEAQQLLDKRIGMVMSIALFTKNNNNLVQSVIGIEMFREGCSEKVFKIMNSLGVSMSIRISKRNVDRLQDDHDKEVKLWKGQVEEQLMLPKKTLAHNIRANRFPAFSLTWDRVRITSQAKHERLGGNKPTIWAFRFAHRNRIPFSNLQGPPKKAVEVSPDSILPSKQTYEALRQRMKTIVMRIIVDNLTALEGLRSKVVWHIPHKYSKQMEKKSNVVNLGAVPVDSSTTKGDSEIMGSLIEYVPTLNEKPHQVLCCSDGLNIDTTEEPSESTARQRFEGLVDAPPEHHKESLCYQDIMKMLFSEKSLEARGSLSQLKSVFAVRGHCIESQVKDTIQRVWDVDFITFVTSAYITLYAATECNLDAVEQQPSDFPTDAEAQIEWLSGLAHRLVDLVWMPPPQEDINAAAATASLSEVKKNDSCFCGEEKPGEPLVQCCSNLCEGVWFHEGCARMVKRTDPSVTQDWFCSPECQEDGTYIYCYCKEQRGGQMVQCALMDQCRRHEWYHKDCLSQNESEQENAASEESTWYCSEMCFIVSDTDDHVLNYTKALVWEGLYNMTRRDAIREGDGEAMTDFWKMDMVLFWARKHLKDFTTCHRLLTGIEGFYPEHIRQDLKWNRVANLEGKPGGNISLDLVNQFMNVEFKDSLGRVSDHYTNWRMELCGMMVGALGSAADRLLIALGAENNSGLTTSLPSTHYHKIKRRGDIAKFVAEYKKDHLFRYIPGRAHQGFEKFAYQQKVKTSKKMGTTMRKLAQDMDQHQ